MGQTIRPVVHSCHTMATAGGPYAGQVAAHFRGRAAGPSTPRNNAESTEPSITLAGWIISIVHAMLTEFDEFADQTAFEPKSNE